MRISDWSSDVCSSDLDEQALDTFLRDVVTPEWHFQHDAGRPFAETSAELAARYPQHADLIGLWGPRFNDSIRGRIEGMAELVAELEEAIGRASGRARGCQCV